jgi:predicted ATP-dependent serine protease
VLAVVKEVKKKGPTLYLCEECGIAYREKEWADKCETYCREYHGCNLEIIEHAMPLE